ncbi:MAG: hypothetical protein NZ842_08620, partial [Dehalococcoidia bacterium]|nr:hypothetical protein [Dehalococcoidia bacterium]
MNWDNITDGRADTLQLLTILYTNTHHSSLGELPDLMEGAKQGQGSCMNKEPSPCPNLTISVPDEQSLMYPSHRARWTDGRRKTTSLLIRTNNQSLLTSIKEERGPAADGLPTSHTRPVQGPESPVLVSDSSSTLVSDQCRGIVRDRF